MNRHRRLKADGGFEGVERIVDADFIWIPCFEFECISVLLIWPIKKSFVSPSRRFPLPAILHFSKINFNLKIELAERINTPPAERAAGSHLDRKDGIFRAPSGRTISRGNSPEISFPVNILRPSGLISGNEDDGQSFRPAGDSTPRRTAATRHFPIAISQTFFVMLNIKKCCMLEGKLLIADN
jgi:hypothetical protein